MIEAVLRRAALGVAYPGFVALGRSPSSSSSESGERTLATAVEADEDPRHDQRLEQADRFGQAFTADQFLANSHLGRI